MGDRRRRADLQNATCITYSGAIHRHINNLLCHTRFVGIVTVMHLKTVVAFSTSITLITTGGFTMSVNTDTATRFTNHPCVSAGLGGDFDSGSIVGGVAEVFNRQLHTKEIKWIEANKLAFAREVFGETLTPAQIDEAEKRLAQQALRSVDYLWSLYLGKDGSDTEAAHYLSTATDTFLNDNGHAQTLFTTEGDDFLRADKYLLNRDDESTALAFYERAVHTGVVNTALDGVKNDTARIKNEIAKAVENLTVEDAKKLLAGAATLGEDALNATADYLEALWDSPGEKIGELASDVWDGTKDKARSLGEGGKVAFGYDDADDTLKAFYGEHATDVIEAQQALYALNVVMTAAEVAGVGKAISVGSQAAVDAAKAGLDNLKDAQNNLSKGIDLNSSEPNNADFDGNDPDSPEAIKQAENDSNGTEATPDVPNQGKQTGAGYTDPADLAYDDIRASITDVDTIAANTGLKPQNIQKIKDHLFIDEHVLDRYVDYGIPAEIKRFDSDIKIADAWKRLENGNHTPEDIQLLKHETAERWIEKKRGAGYTESHDRATESYPAPDWWSE